MIIAPQEFRDPISSEVAEDVFAKQLETEKTRQKIISVLKEEFEKTYFSNLVRQYAAEEMDRRVFKSFQYWGTVVLTTVITSVVAFVISRALGE